MSRTESMMVEYLQMMLIFNHSYVCTASFNTVFLVEMYRGLEKVGEISVKSKS